MVYSRPPWRRRRRDAANGAAPRPLGCLWPIFWLILIIVILGLLFGGYRKGTKIGAPQQPVRLSSYASTYTYSVGQY
ncbi:MAG TPA: hypothetical protein VFU74_20870 [Actinocrinis sp.]|nr:hypothetical protein [Actinocrinis sp.]